MTCDHNAQLEAVAPSIIGGDEDPSIRRAREYFPDAGPIGYDLARPIDFDDSRNRPAIQIADLVAGTAATCGLGRIAKRGLEAHLSAIDRHLHPNAIFPDFSVVRAQDREPMVNWAVLHALGDRARRGEDPYHRLSELYREAERAWDRGELRASTTDR